MCGGKKKGLPPIEQHPLQIRQRPVQKAQSQKKNCLLLHHSALIAGASARQQPIEKEKLIDKVGALSTTLPSNGSSLVSVGKGTK